MRIVVFTDPHIEEKSIEELGKFFDNLIEIPADVCVCIGDYYDKKRPTVNEIKYGTLWASWLKNTFSDVYFIKGNHDEISNELSSIDYLNNLGIHVVPELVLDNIGFFHCMTEKSNMAFSTVVPNASKWEKHLKDFDKYTLTFLGHQHSFQEVGEKVYHLGSCRYIDFGEVNDEHKYVALINSKSNELEFLENDDILPMKEVSTIKALEDIDRKTKTRYLFTSFDQFKKEINKVSELSKEFAIFKTKLNFKEEPKEKKVEVENINLNSIIKKWLEDIDDNDVKKELKTEFEKANI